MWFAQARWHRGGIVRTLRGQKLETRMTKPHPQTRRGIARVHDASREWTPHKINRREQDEGTEDKEYDPSLV